MDIHKSLPTLVFTGIIFLVPAVERAYTELPANPSVPTPAAAGDRKRPPRTDGFGDPLPDDALFRFGSVRMRHVPAILGSALSPDGKLLATTSGRSVLLWDLKAGKALRHFDCQQFWHFTNPHLVFSPDGRHLGYVQSTDFACVWDVTDGKQVAIFVGGNRQNTICRFSPDGKTFLFSRDERLIFWDLQKRREIRWLRIKDAFLLSPDARFCVCFDRPSGLRFIDTSSGEETGRPDVDARHNGFSNGVAFTPDGKTLAVVHENKQIQVRGFPNGKMIFSFPLPASAKRFVVNIGDYFEYQLSFADHQTLMLGTERGLTHRWDLATGKELPTLSKHVGSVIGGHALPEGKIILTTGADGLIRRWDRQTGRELSEPPGYMGRTHAVYSPDGRYVVIGDSRGLLELWDAHTGQSLRVLQKEGPAVTKLAASPRGLLFAVARADNTVHFWTLPHGKDVGVLRCDGQHNLANVWTMLFSPDGNHLLIADCRYHARLWDVALGKVQWSELFGSAVFSPDGQTLAMVDTGPYLNLLDASSGKQRIRLHQDTGISEDLGIVPAMAFSPDGKHLALAVDGVHVCDARTGATLHHFQAADLPGGTPEVLRRKMRLVGEGGVHGLAFSPDGRWLGTSGFDGSVRLWEVATGKQVLRLDGHGGDVAQIAFGADSRTLLSCGKDAQAYLWSLRPLKETDARTSLDSLWSMLAQEPAKAYSAIWKLCEADGSVAFLRRKLPVVKPVSELDLKKLIADLENDKFAERERATQKLAELGEMVVPAMRQALENKPPLEARRRLEQLLRQFEGKQFSPDQPRILRAIDVLERQDTAEARRLLKDLAAGAPGALLTIEAQATLKRLSR